MDYLEVTVAVAPALAERAADVLRELDPSGVSIEDPIEPTDHDGSYRRRDDAPALVKAYLRAVRDDVVTPIVRSMLGEAGVEGEVWTRFIREEDWAEAWKAHFGVHRYGRIVVCPSWLEADLGADEVLVRLDPGMAFGTGDHPTTRTCLLALDRYLRPGDAVLDVGTGSGILAIAAARLGARAVLALDIDPVCVEVAGRNVADNGLAGSVTVALGSAGDRWPFAEPASSRFDLAVANITAKALIDLAPALRDAVRPGGLLVLSGIVAPREGEVERAFADTEPVERMAEGDWRTLIRRRA
jgi:ribosomal protein L11 methyltransferase